MLVMIILVRWFLATNAGLTRNWLENGCIDQPSALVWAVFGQSRINCMMETLLNSVET